MKVSYDEGLASHIGSESCGSIRKDAVEALTGVCAGWVLSLENVFRFIRFLRSVTQIGRTLRGCGVVEFTALAATSRG